MAGTGSPTPETPLLNDDVHSHSDSSTNGSDSQRPPKSPFYPYAPILCGLMSVVADFSGALVDTPEVRVLEMAVCRDYFRMHDPSVIGEPPLSYVDERLRKTNEIQVNLAYLRAIKFMLMTIPGLLLTFSYGRLADKIGRKPVLLLGMTGEILAYLWLIIICYFHEIFPTRLVLASSAFLVVGGGARVLSAVIKTIIVDVSPAEMRTTVFYLLGAAVLITNIVAILIGSWLLAKDLWLPYKFSVPVALLAYPIILAMPETVPAGRGQQRPRTQIERTSRLQHLQKAPTKNSLLGQAYQRLKDDLSAFFINKSITICLAINFLNAFSYQSAGVFTQFTSKLLDWPIATAGYLLAVQAFVSLGALVALVLITRFIEARSTIPPLAVDIWTVGVSLGFLIAGSLVTGYSRNAAVLVIGSVLASAGTGVFLTMQGVIASFAEPSTMGQLYAGNALVELAGGLTGSFSFAAIFGLGVTLQSQWSLGLPYYTSAFLFTLSLLLLLKLSKEKDHHSSHASVPSQ